MNTYKDIYKRKKTMNDINPTTGLPMSGGGIDVGGTCWDAKNLATECIHTWPADAL